MNLLAIETATDACSVGLLIGDDRRFDHRIEPRQHARLVLPMIDALLAEAGLPRSSLDGVVFGRGPGSFTGVRVAASVTQGIALGLDIGVIGISTLATIAQGCHREFGDQRVGVALDARLDEVYWGAFSSVSPTGADAYVDAVAGAVARAGTSTDANADADADVDVDVVTGVNVDSTVMQSVCSERVCLPGAVTFGAEHTTDAIVPGDPALQVLASKEAETLSWQLAGAGVERYGDIIAKALGLAGTVPRRGRLPQAQDLLTLALPLACRGAFGPPESAVPVYLRERVALTEAERGISHA